MTIALTSTLTTPPSSAPSGVKIQYKPLHPTFVAEASGVDLTQPTPEVVSEIKAGLAKVCVSSASNCPCFRRRAMTVSCARPLHPCSVVRHWKVYRAIADGQYGVLVFRQTGLTDDSHVALSRLFGQLDDVTPYNKLGRINRLKYDE
jgi:alpha-ketoglutarate-dependent 2,4-dichlorophenoxyacetate dioxygenase